MRYYAFKSLKTLLYVLVIESPGKFTGSPASSFYVQGTKLFLFLILYLGYNRIMYQINVLKSDVSYSCILAL